MQIDCRVTEWREMMARMSITLPKCSTFASKTPNLKVVGILFGLIGWLLTDEVIFNGKHPYNLSYLYPVDLLRLNFGAVQFF
jgi:hypothetical protein